MVKVQDDIYGYEWLEGNTRLCPHPGVIQKYGHEGRCRVCVYTCMKCRDAVHFPMHSGVACGYGTEKDDDARYDADTINASGTGKAAGTSKDTAAVREHRNAISKDLFDVPAAQAKSTL